MRTRASALKVFGMLALCICTLVAQDLRYIEYDKDLLPVSFHKARRDSVMEKIGKDAVAIFYAAPERGRNGDVHYQYRQDDNFYYLTGLTEPNAILALVPKGISVRDPLDTAKRVTTSEILFVQARDPSSERWTGRRYGPEGAMKLRGVQCAFTNDKFKSMFQQILLSARGGTVYLPTFTSDLTGEISDLLQPVRSWVDAARTRNSGFELRDPTAMVQKMRARKSPEEIELITKATRISALAHNQAMMSCQPGMHEYELQALYEYVFRRLGAEYNGYPCIVGAAENSVILHYNSDRRTINNGDIVLADCAAEYHGYSSDVTRTYPANGKFSPAQRKIYQIVLDAQNAAIAMMKTGVSMRDVTAKVDQVVEDGVFKLGFIKEKNGKEFRNFLPHGIGHAVGLDVHDVGVPLLEPGVIYTIEPGVYVQEGAEGVDPAYYNIGVRIEDIVLVTPDGNKLLSADSPREMDAIEAMMARKGIGNEPVEGGGKK